MSNTMFIGSISADWLRDEMTSFIREDIGEEVDINTLWFGLHQDEIEVYSRKSGVLEVDLDDTKRRVIFFKGNTTTSNKEIVVGSIDAEFTNTRLTPTFKMVHFIIDSATQYSVTSKPEPTTNVLISKDDLFKSLVLAEQLQSAITIANTLLYYCIGFQEPEEEELDPIYKVEFKDSLAHLLSYRSYIPKHILPVLFKEHEDLVKYGREWTFYRKTDSVVEPYLKGVKTKPGCKVSVLVSSMEELKDFMFVEVKSGHFRGYSVEQHEIYMFRRKYRMGAKHRCCIVLEDLKDGKLTFKDWIEECVGKLTVSYVNSDKSKPYVTFSQIKAPLMEIHNFEMLVPGSESGSLGFNIATDETEVPHEVSKKIDFERELKYEIGNESKERNAIPFFKKYDSNFNHLDGLVYDLSDDMGDLRFKVKYTPVASNEEIHVVVRESFIEQFSFREILDLETEVLREYGCRDVEVVKGKVKCYLATKRMSIHGEDVSIETFGTIEFELRR